MSTWGVHTTFRRSDLPKRVTCIKDGVVSVKRAWGVLDSKGETASFSFTSLEGAAAFPFPLVYVAPVEVWISWRGRVPRDKRSEIEEVNSVEWRGGRYSVVRWGTDVLVNFLSRGVYLLEARDLFDDLLGELDLP